MFRKTLKTKFNTQLKQSDRKKLLIRVATDLCLFDDEIGLLFPLKDPIYAVKVQNQHMESCIVYLSESTPLVFDIDGRLFPTVNLLWRYPHAVPVFTTNDFVMEKLSGGADLMRPGVHYLTRCLKKGDVVGVNTISNSAPMAVGIFVVDFRDYLTDRQGKVVSIVHTVGDKVYEMAKEVSVVPNFGPPVAVITDDFFEYCDNELGTEPGERNKIEELLESMRNLHRERCIGCDHPDPVSSKCIAKASTSSTVVESDSTPVSSHVPSDSTGSPDRSISSSANSSDMNELVTYCFLKAIRSQEIILPILTNLFYKNHMTVQAPAGVALDVKKSRYKKLSVFLKALESEGVIKTEDVKGVQSIIEINRSHTLIKEFVDPYLHDIKETSCQTEKKPETPDSPGPSSINEGFFVNASTLPLFSSCKFNKGDVVTRDQVRAVIEEYVKKENLNCNGAVQMDPILAQLLNTKSPTMPWATLIKRVEEKLGKCYTIRTGSGKVLSAKGSLPPVEINLASRAGNKKVTLVNNLQVYGINVAEFSHTCQVALAASATVNELPGTKKLQFQIQGNQIVYISKLLVEKYNIPKKHISGYMEKAAKKK